MKKNCFRRILACLLVLVLCCQMRVPALAYELTGQRLTDAGEAAEELYQMGLLQGAGTNSDGSPDFALNRTMTRGEAVAMLARIMGGDREAQERNYAYPFTDVPKWAAPYVGYAYHYGISEGISADVFGTTDNITLKQFMTLLLRALDYHDVSWRDPIPDARSAGLDFPEQYSHVDRFCRGDAILMCRSALDSLVLDEGMTLLSLLEKQGTLPQQRENVIPGFTPGPVTQIVTDITVANTNEISAKMRTAVNGLAPRMTIHCPAGSEKAYSQALGQTSPSWAAGVNSVSTEYIPGSGEMVVVFGYLSSLQVQAYLQGKTNNPDQETLQLLEKLKEIMPGIVDPSMSEYELVRAIHDYIVDHVYYQSGKRDQTAAGALLDGYAVCSGYMDAFDLMCYLTGIECLQVTGTANSVNGSGWGPHGWNKVKVDGQWYNVDCTWDDPVGATPSLRHDYFLISDTELAKTHKWERSDGLPESPVSYPQ